MNQSILIAVFSFVIILAIALLFLYLYLKAVHDEILNYWNTVLDKMRLRNDMVPNLIETVRKYSKNDDKILQEMIQLRSKSWPMADSNSQKVNVELSLTDDLRAIWKLPEKVHGLNLDTNFLSLKKDFHDLGKEIDAMVDVYNKKIRGYNSRVGFLLFKPFFRLMGLKKFSIFEFEP